MDNPVADGVIAKVDDDKKLVFGWASIIKDVDGKVLLDRQDDYIDDEEELEKAAYTYVLHSRDGGEMHVRTGVSTMVESVVLSKEKQAALGIPEGVVPVGWWIGFKVNDDRVWDQVKKGDYMGFSVHGTGQRQQGILKDGEYTEVEKGEQTQAQKMREHGRTQTPEHMAMMRRLMKEGMSMDEAHAEAEKQLKKDDCGCGCGGQNETIQVSKRLLRLLTKAHGGKKVATVMDEFKAGKLKTSTGEKVTDAKQAMAIALSEQRRMKKGDFPGHPFRGNQWTKGRGSGKGSAGGGKGKEDSKTKRPKSVDDALNDLKSGKKTSLSSVADVDDFLVEMQKAVKSMEKGEIDKFNLCKVTVPGTNLFCGNSKGIPRIEMPQIGGKPIKGSEADKLPKSKEGEVDGSDAFIKRLEKKGVKVTEKKMKVSELKASQNELKGKTVSWMATNDEGFDPGGKPIFVSKDGYVIDGHHRWAALVGRDTSDGKLGDVKMDVRVVDMKIMDVLKEANDFADDFGIAPKAAK